MPVEGISGDLFTNRFGAQALAHGCNCQGSMGAGIAVGFRGGTGGSGAARHHVPLAPGNR
jgi:O-acetyl-ADP-ribose deacetylase (regulator of RNase III)